MREGEFKKNGNVELTPINLVAYTTVTFVWIFSIVPQWDPFKDGDCGNSKKKITGAHIM